MLSLVPTRLTWGLLPHRSTFCIVDELRAVYKFLGEPIMAAVLPAGPRTVAATILPGWMPKPHALRLLTSECIEPCLDANQAAETWEEFHRRVEESPVRDLTAPHRLELTQDE